MEAASSDDSKLYKYHAPRWMPVWGFLPLAPHPPVGHLLPREVREKALMGVAFSRPLTGEGARRADEGQTAGRWPVM